MVHPDTTQEGVRKMKANLKTVVIATALLAVSIGGAVATEQ
jgi:hypothetical protein